LETKKHKSSAEAEMSSSRLTHFFKAAHSDEFLLLAAKEAIILRIMLLFTDSRLKVLIAASKLILIFYNLNFPIQEQNVNQ